MKYFRYLGYRWQTRHICVTSSTNRISKMSMSSVIQVNRIYLIF